MADMSRLIKEIVRDLGRKDAPVYVAMMDGSVRELRAEAMPLLMAIGLDEATDEQIRQLETFAS